MNRRKQIKKRKFVFGASEIYFNPIPCNNNGFLSPPSTDVFVTAVSATGNGDYEIYPAENLVDLINTERQESDSPFNAIYITSVEVL